jgi:hypothetical protein
MTPQTVEERKKLFDKRGVRFIKRQFINSARAVARSQTYMDLHSHSISTFLAHVAKVKHSCVGAHAIKIIAHGLRTEISRSIENITSLERFFEDPIAAAGKKGSHSDVANREHHFENVHPLGLPPLLFDEPAVSENDSPCGLAIQISRMLEEERLQCWPSRHLLLFLF